MPKCFATVALMLQRQLSLMMHCESEFVMCKRKIMQMIFTKIDMIKTQLVAKRNAVESIFANKTIEITNYNKILICLKISILNNIAVHGI